MAQQINFRVPANLLHTIVGNTPNLEIIIAGQLYNVRSQASSKGTYFHAARRETDVKQTFKRERELKSVGITPLIELGK